MAAAQAVAWTLMNFNHHSFRLAEAAAYGAGSALVGLVVSAICDLRLRQRFAVGGLLAASAGRSHGPTATGGPGNAAAGRGGGVGGVGGVAARKGGSDGDAGAFPQPL
jgi:hypothetical protein